MDMQGELDRPGDPEFMSSLARGLAVMRCVAESGRSVTIADVSRRLGLSRAAVRRCLHTLNLLGYVGQDAQGYVVRRQALSLGHPYLSLNALAARAQPMLNRLRDMLGESCSLGLMEEDHLLYVARAETARIMSIGLRVGSRIPLYPTSMGRVLLAGCSREAQEAYLARTELRPLTGRTVTDRVKLLAIFQQVAAQGHAVIDEELEDGVRSVAVPVRGRGGVVAAMNVGMSTARVSMHELHERILPALREVAAELDG